LVDVIIKSDDNRRQIKAKTDKSQTYEQLLSYLVQDHKELEEYITLQTEDNDIYIPNEEKSLPEKTVIAKKIKQEQFINALFQNTSLVTTNVREAYYTDEQKYKMEEIDDMSLEYNNTISYKSDSS